MGEQTPIFIGPPLPKPRRFSTHSHLQWRLARSDVADRWEIGDNQSLGLGPATRTAGLQPACPRLLKLLGMPLEGNS